ncbi:MAG TPA: carboxypeptidase regulatory-like domain-containing protein, partial [Pyrinomonadaceae bacterium]|nr:carboxypeptidase regulatory-like domain-containing protein [Pyrinomonadaceae bacterium]
MSNQRSLDPPQLNSPCTADWDSMIGSEGARFCKHCQLNVHEISQFNEKQFDRLLRKSGDRLCIRYLAPKPITAGPPVLHQIARRTSVLAGTALSAGLTLSAAIGAPMRTANPQAVPLATISSESATSRDASGTGIIRGVIFDPNSATIAGATVKLAGNESGKYAFSITNDAGEYVFAGLDVGSYNLRVEARGFAAADIPNIVLRENDDNRIDQTLSIQPISETVEVVSEVFELQGGASVRFATEPLVRAAQEDNLDELNSLLLSHKNVNIRDSATGNTALELAVQHGNREVVQALLWAKADVNAKNRSGQTALMMLTDKVTADILWDLISAGAKVNLKDNDGDTALSEVAQ